MCLRNKQSVLDFFEGKIQLPMKALWKMMQAVTSVNLFLHKHIAIDSITILHVFHNTLLKATYSI